MRVSCFTTPLCLQLVTAVIMYVIAEQRYYSTSVRPTTLLLGHRATAVDGCYAAH